jgi:hypothetical protein
MGPNNQAIVINFHQDFVAITHNSFFKGQTDMGLPIGLTIPGQLSCPDMTKKRKRMFT